LQQDSLVDVPTRKWRQQLRLDYASGRTLDGWMPMR
jgi:hypothetical protein